MSYNPTSSDNPIDEQSQLQTDNHSGTEAQLLDVVAMPLKGRHLIEASAGTGKTFNIVIRIPQNYCQSDLVRLNIMP